MPIAKPGLVCQALVPPLRTIFSRFGLFLPEIVPIFACKSLIHNHKPTFLISLGNKKNIRMSKKLRIGSWDWHLPKSRWARIIVGIGLIFGGILGFLPVLGFWMVPLGFLVLSIDLPIVRRWRRKLTVWWHNRRDRKKHLQRTY